MKNKNLFASLVIGALATASSFAQAYNCEGCLPLADRDTVLLSSIADANGNLTAAHSIWTCDKLYILDRKIYVPANGTLTIMPGVVVKADYLGDLNSSALIVPRDAKIYASGSECCPIIFTSVSDPLDGTYPIYTKERWGGIIILGRAHNTVARGELGPENPNFVTGGPVQGLGAIEGIDAADARHYYGVEAGAFNNDDNSGILNYVSIRHGGSELGLTNEINGLTLGSVGRGTTLRNIEVISNGDDGIEFFGGTVDLKYARVLYCEDDYLDWDQGYTGRIQHVIAVTRPATAPGAVGLGDNGIEADGDDGIAYVRPWLSDPIVSNLTMIGRTTDVALELKERTEGEIYNSIFANFATGVKYTASSTAGVVVKNNTFVNNIANVSGTPVVGLEPTAPANNNTFVASLSGFTSTNWSSIWDAVPVSTGSTFNFATAVEDAAQIAAGRLPANYYDWFDATTYQGAYKPGTQVWWSMINCPNAQGANEFDESFSSISAPSDLNNDGVTNSGDLSVLLGRYNKANNE